MTFRLAVFFFTLLFSIIMLEIGFRIANFQPKTRAAVPYTFELSEVPELFFEMKANNEYTWEYGARSLFKGGFSVPVKTNSYGLRDDEFDIPKPENVLRILAIGDSFTLAIGVPVEQGYVEQLENILNRITNGNPIIEVINAGVGGYSIQQELAYFNAKGKYIEPDMVLLGLMVNDLRDQDSYTIDRIGFLKYKDKSTSAQQHIFKTLVYDPDPQRNTLKWLFEESHLIRWLAKRKVRRIKTTIMEYHSSRNRKKGLQKLLQFRNSVQKEQIPFLVAIFPYLDNFEKHKIHRQDYELIQQTCKSNGITYIKMGDALKGLSYEKLWVHPGDHHPNAQAHKLYAELISNYIEIENCKISLNCFPK